METRKRRLIVGKVGGTASKGSVNYKVSLPSPWIKCMGLGRDNKDVEIAFDGTKIIIYKD